MTKPHTIKIAVVDDHPIVVVGLEATLASEDRMVVATAANSMGQLVSRGPLDADLLLLDLNIPGETYRENLEHARKHWPGVRVAAYTSYNYPDLVRETLKLGFCGFLLKQVSREALIEGLFAICEGERYVSTEVKSTAVKTARKPKRGEVPTDDFQKRLLLSKREKEILHHISKGSTSQQIADTLYISRYTVETHRKNILRKLDFNTSTELVKFAVEQGLV